MSSNEQTHVDEARQWQCVAEGCNDMPTPMVVSDSKQTKGHNSPGPASAVGTPRGLCLQQGQVLPRGQASLQMLPVFNSIVPNLINIRTLIGVLAPPGAITMTLDWVFIAMVHFSQSWRLESEASTRQTPCVREPAACFLHQGFLG